MDKQGKRKSSLSRRRSSIFKQHAVHGSPKYDMKSFSFEIAGKIVMPWTR
jgi:hypothetical protein